MAMCQRLVAKNDINGNPRRCWLRFNNDGGLKDVIDEGYGGTPKECQLDIELFGVEIEVAEYERFIKQGEILRGSDVD